MSRSRAEVRGYFHDDVELGTSPSADYVVEHAARQRQRGRNPSTRYGGITNPREALAAAESDIELRESSDDYTAAFSGRVALIKVWSDRQRQVAEEYAGHVINERNATGAVIKDVEDGEELQAPLHYRVTAEGSVEAMLPLN